MFKCFFCSWTSNTSNTTYCPYVVVQAEKLQDIQSTDKSRIRCVCEIGSISEDNVDGGGKSTQKEYVEAQRRKEWLNKQLDYASYLVFSLKH